MEQDLDAALSILGATAPSLDALLRHLPEALTVANEGEGTWTITEVLAHLIHGERTNWLPRVQILLGKGESEPFPIFLREGQGEQLRPVASLLNEFTELRAASLAEFRSLHLLPEDFRRRGCHPAFGPVTLTQLLAAWTVHDMTHMHQITRILAFQYRETVGPWARYLGVLHCEGHSEKV